MRKYYELATKSKHLVSFEESEKEVTDIRRFNGVNWVPDLDVENSVQMAKKYNIMSSLGKELNEEELSKAVANKIAKLIDGDTKEFE